MKKKTNPVEEVFVRAVLEEARTYMSPEYVQEMLNAGVKEKQLRGAAIEFALDSVHHLVKRLTPSEIKEVERRLKKISLVGM